MNSRWLRYAFLTLALAFCVYGLVTQWTEISAALATLSAGALAGALACGLAGLFCWMLGWRALLAGFGSPLPLPAAFRILFLGQLGKYVPGSVWALVGQVSLGVPYGVPKARSASAALLAMATTVATGSLVAACALPFASTAATHRYWWALLAAPVLLACLHPRVVTWALNLALRLVRRPELDAPIGPGPMALAVGWTLLGWIFFGAHIWLLMPEGSGLLAVGAYALAYVVGFLVIFAPGGLGAREAALVVALAPALTRADALVVALASRAVLTAADLLYAFIASLGNAPDPRDLVSEESPSKEMQ